MLARGASWGCTVITVGMWVLLFSPIPSYSPIVFFAALHLFPIAAIGAAMVARKWTTIDSVAMGLSFGLLLTLLLADVAAILVRTTTSHLWLSSASSFLA